jgi:small subunit ribosomal protein S1
LLSHKATWSTEEEKPAAQQPKKKAAAPKGKTIDKINQESEKSTLGDLEALSALKEKMSASKQAASGEAKPE